MNSVNKQWVSRKIQTDVRAITSVPAEFTACWQCVTEVLTGNHGDCWRCREGWRTSSNTTLPLSKANLINFYYSFVQCSILIGRLQHDKVWYLCTADRCYGEQPVSGHRHSSDHRVAIKSFLNNIFSLFFSENTCVKERLQQCNNERKTKGR